MRVKMGSGTTGKLDRAWHRCMGGAWVASGFGVSLNYVLNVKLPIMTVVPK